MQVLDDPLPASLVGGNRQRPTTGVADEDAHRFGSFSFSACAVTAAGIISIARSGQ